MKRLQPTVMSKQRMKRSLAVFVSTAMLAGSLMGFAGQAEAAQPHSSYWYPNTLLEWSPATDRDAAFNKGSVKLVQDRVKGYKVNPNALEDPKLMALASMYPNTSGVPSQGSEKFNTFTFGYWQYVDKLIMWGGSAGEGLIVPPSADVIDAAHKNGVPVYGTVFFPQKEHGGKLQWLRDMLQQREDGSFPTADKLLEAASYYGFDGWFINQETQGASPQDAQLMQQFMKYLQQHKQPGMEIIWYDSMIDQGPVSWQGALTDRNRMFFQDGGERVSDTMFLDFRWQYSGYAFQNSPSVAQSLNRSPYDLYAGIDVEANGYNGTFNLPALFPEGGKAATSLGIYRPDWAWNSSKTHEEYMEKESTFWSGYEHNPAATPPRPGAGDATKSRTWRGAANYFVDKSVITGPEFITHFNMGNGHLFAVNGDVVRSRDWSNRSLQDILPTWRWIAESEGTGQALRPSFDYENAYYGGSSLKVSGDLRPDSATHVKLYKTDVRVEPTTVVSATYKANDENARIQIGVSFNDAPEQYVYLDPASVELADGTSVTDAVYKNKWVRSTVTLATYADRTIAGISLKVDSPEPIDGLQVNIGELSIRKTDAAAPQLGAVNGLQVTEADFRDGVYGDARLKWEALGEEALYYQVYRVKPDGARELIGATANNVYYVPEMKRIDKEAATALEVVPINRHYEQGERASVSLEWPGYPQPTADFEADQTLIAPGDTVKFADKSSEVTESWLWSFPGGHPESSAERNPQVRYDQEGVYEVTLTAKNSEGADSITKKLITVTKEAAGGIADLARNKKTDASSYVNSNEAPRFAVDGNDRTKWCAVGDGPHWLTVDLGAVRQVSEFVVKHAQAGGEGEAFNTRAFRIQLSLDGVNWSDAVEVKDNTQGVSKHAIGLTKARYAKLIVDKPTQGGDTAARIYGFEVRGLK